jgi:hypothetical protein
MRKPVKLQESRDITNRETNLYVRLIDDLELDVTVLYRRRVQSSGGRETCLLKYAAWRRSAKVGPRTLTKNLARNDFQRVTLRNVVGPHFN